MKPLQAISHNIMTRISTAPPTISFICRFCSHIFRLRCLPCLWKLSACNFENNTNNHNVGGKLGRTDMDTGHDTNMHSVTWENMKYSCQCLIINTWNCKFSVLSTRSSIFSPRSKTCNQAMQRLLWPDCPISAKHFMI